MADLSLSCPVCGKENTLPLDSSSDTFTCEGCGQSSTVDEAATVPHQPAPDYLVGQVVSECKIVEKVGEGGFGTVYKAIDQNLQRPVALKVMLQSHATNTEFVQKFIREAVTAAQLNHPNIVAIHKVGKDERRGLHYLIMEFVEGATLQDVVKKKGVLTLDDALPLMLQSCDALATAHERNIVHRDIKPENLMVDGHGVLKITDFGLAKSLSSEQKTTKVMGTPHYMSPEQFEGKAVDGRSDIYSLGVTFYYLLSKGRPYEGENTVQIIYSILTQQPKPLTDVNADVPPPVWSLIQKMIAKDPADRYQTLRETILDLRTLKDRELAAKTICPGCSTQNPKGRKFCRSCGAALMVKCPACAHVEPVGTAACSSCGADVSRLLKVQKAVESAKRFKTMGDLRRAAESYRQILQLDPSHSEAAAELDHLGGTLEEVDRVRSEAVDLAKTGELASALDNLEALLTKFPSAQEVREHRDELRGALAARKVNTLLESSEEAISTGDVRGALELLDQALREDPGREDVREKRNDLSRRLSTVAANRRKAAQALAAGRYEEAFQLATEVLKFTPDDTAMQDVVEKSRSSVASVDQFVSRGRERLDRNDLSAALSEFEAALSVRPGDKEIFQLLEQTRQRIAARREKLALCRRHIADRAFDDASKVLDQVLEAAPDDMEARTLRKQCDKGLAEIERARRVEQRIGEGEALLAKGDLAGALKCFEEVTELDPRHEDARSRREMLEQKVREERDVRVLADEQLQNGRFGEAVEALERLKLVNEARAASIDSEIAEARRREQQVTAAVRRAEDALQSREYKRAEESAQSVLDIAPRHPRAVAIKKDAEKVLTTINRFLSECDNLILSEMFDEALDALDKAKERGATEEEYRNRRAQCDQGRLAMLKSDATRSLVVKDFEAAIAAYEQVLETDSSDEDALKGKRAAERRLRILTTEPLSLRLGAAALVMACLAIVQTLALASTKTAEVRSETAAGPVVVVEATSRGKTEPALGLPLAAEREGRFAEAAELWAKELAEFPNVARLAVGRDYNRAMAAALEKPTPEQRLDAVSVVLPGAGAELDDRETQIEELTQRFVDEWKLGIEAREESDPNAAIEEYRRIVDHPVAKNAPGISKVAERAVYLNAVAFGDETMAKGAFADAAAGYIQARSAASDDRARKLVEGRIKTVEDAWIGDLARRSKAIPAGPEAEQQLYDEIVVGLESMVRSLGLSRDEVWRLFQNKAGR